MHFFIQETLSFNLMYVAACYPVGTTISKTSSLFTAFLQHYIVGFCNCSMICCALLCVHSSFAIISMGKRELVALLCLFSWCIVIDVWLFRTIPRFCL